MALMMLSNKHLFTINLAFFIALKVTSTHQLLLHIICLLNNCCYFIHTLYASSIAEQRFHCVKKTLWSILITFLHVNMLHITARAGGCLPYLLPPRLPQPWCRAMSREGYFIILATSHTKLTTSLLGYR